VIKPRPYPSQAIKAGFAGKFAAAIRQSSLISETQKAPAHADAFLVGGDGLEPPTSCV
jgi:hypothetical protein